MNIVFLDIDGVLNNDSLWELRVPDDEYFQIFPENLEFFMSAVRRIRKRRDLQIVMSTSWRLAGRDEFSKFIRDAVPERSEEFLALLHEDLCTKSLGDVRGEEVAE